MIIACLCRDWTAPLRRPAPCAAALGERPCPAALPFRKPSLGAYRKPQSSKACLDAAVFPNRAFGGEEAAVADMADLSIADEHFNIMTITITLVRDERDRPNAIVGAARPRRTSRSKQGQDHKRRNRRGASDNVMGSLSVSAPQWSNKARVWSAVRYLDYACGVPAAL